MSFATTEHLRLLLRESAWTDEQTATAQLLLDLAHGVITDEVGQLLEQSTDTVVLDGPTRDDSRHHPATGSRRLILPRWPVTAVDSVTEDGTVLTVGTSADYTWSAAGILTRIGADWPTSDRSVEVTYTAGYATAPAGLTRMELRLAAVGWSNPEFLSSETLGDHARSFSADALGMELTRGDIRSLGAYRART
ncbi:hypothetical protein [Streptomyces sp. C10-9-1]|uniref:hypothetical protein n=1 Tax=Streptomyces sp. C10-9-1 TaxID=1859285 RepID=UPI003F49EF33